MLKVVKFGGSSLADSGQFEKVKKIILSDEDRKVVVVSAIGKRNKQDNKITDLLYLTHAHLKYGVEANSIFNLIKERYLEVENSLKINAHINEELKIIEDKLNKNINVDYLVSRGEYLSAKIVACYLGYQFVDAAEVIRFNYDGSVNEKFIREKLKEYKDLNLRIVIPGFYGSYPDGSIHLLSRGGSDVTGALVAQAMDASLYENWTDVSGFYVTDPRIVNSPKQIKQISYEELRELSYMGANVLHEDTIFPVQELEIPINVRNTNHPEDEGTIIASKCTDTSDIITGITGKKDYTSITIIKKAKVEKLLVIRKVLDVFNKYNVNVEHMPSSIDTFSLIVEDNKLDKQLYEIIAELKNIDEVQDILVEKGIALIAIVGRNMALKPGISARVFSIFGENNINIKVIAQASQELSIIVGVMNSQFEQAIKAIYEGLVR